MEVNQAIGDEMINSGEVTKRENTPTGGSTVPKNFDLNKNLTI